MIILLYTVRMSEKNVFQKIIDREISAEIVYEDDAYLAFLDIAPVSYGHTLLIPKDNYTWIQDAPDTVVADLFIKTKQLLIGIKKALNCDYVQIGVAGNEVPHLHVHLIPRFHGDQIFVGRKSYEHEDQMKEYAEKIKSAL